jgi:hypothetical protein
VATTLQFCEERFYLFPLTLCVSELLCRPEISRALSSCFVHVGVCRQGEDEDREEASSERPTQSYEESEGCLAFVPPFDGACKPAGSISCARLSHPWVWPLSVKAAPCPPPDGLVVAYSIRLASTLRESRSHLTLEQANGNRCHRKNTQSVYLA